MDFWHFYIPVFAVCGLHLMLELCRKPQPAARTDGLWKTALALLPITAIGICACIAAVSLWFRIMQRSIIPSVMLAVLTVIVFLTVMLKKCIAMRLSPSKKNRIISAALLLLFYLLGTTAFFILVIGYI